MEESWWKIQTVERERMVEWGSGGRPHICHFTLHTPACTCLCTALCTCTFLEGLHYHTCTLPRPHHTSGKAGRPLHPAPLSLSAHHHHTLHLFGV